MLLILYCNCFYISKGDVFCLEKKNNFNKYGIKCRLNNKFKVFRVENIVGMDDKVSYSIYVF